MEKNDKKIWLDKKNWLDKKIWLGIAVLAIGTFVLPQTVAMFSGQHNWYDTTQVGNQVPCEKCHADISQEMQQPGLVNVIHNIMGCDQCHITAAPNSEGNFQGPGKQFHAAATAACLDCHNTTLLYGTFDHSRIINTGLGCLDCHRNPQQIPGTFSAVEILTGSAEVHKPFANSSTNSSLLKGANEACVSCHTHVTVNISWTRATTMEFNVSMSVVNGTKVYAFSNFTATGQNFTSTSG